MALPAGRKGVLPSELTPEGKIKGSSYVLPVASADVLGGVKVGTGLAIDNGVLSADAYVLPAASDEALGGVKVGTGLSIDENGVLSSTASGGKVYMHNVSVDPNSSDEVFKFYSSSSEPLDTGAKFLNYLRQKNINSIKKMIPAWAKSSTTDSLYTIGIYARLSNDSDVRTFKVKNDLTTTVYEMYASTEFSDSVYEI